MLWHFSNLSQRNEAQKLSMTAMGRLWPERVESGRRHNPDVALDGDRRGPLMNDVFGAALAFALPAVLHYAPFCGESGFWSRS